MPIHLLKLIGKRELAKKTIEFAFHKPENFNFKPGQYGGFTLVHPEHTDAGGITRRFSLLSSPDDKYIVIATRIQDSAFKQSLEAMPVGSDIKFAGPTGNFILPEDISKPIVMIAGGIGVAPFYSMISYNTKHHPERKMTLFYGNQNPETTVLLEELLELNRMNDNFTFIPTMAETGNTWVGEKGYITHTMIRKHVPDLNAPTYYICGSPTMVTVIQELLAEMEINEDFILTEDFPGY